MNIQPKPKSEIDSLRPCCDGNQGPVVGRWGAVLLMAFVSCPFLHGETLEKQITFAPHGHILTNWATWSPDSQWLVYDIRSDPAGDRFDGTRIERVNVATGETQVLFRTDHGAYCGVATTCPADGKIVFIHGPENPDEHWQYGAFHRRGVLVDTKQPGKAANLDARNLVAPYTAGALRGGTHVHTFSRDGQWVSFTYEDHVLAEVSNSESGLGSASGLGSSKAGPDAGDVEQRDLNQRNVGVSVPHDGVSSPKSHPRNHDGTHFTVLVTRTENSPKPGSDEIDRAFSDAWVGHAGYIKSDGSRQRRAIAFQGHVRTSSGETISEVFVVDIPEDVTVAANDGPLQGTQTQRPMPPQGTRQRRLTYTQDRAYPGLQGARHWLRSSPDGVKIAFLMKDDAGVSQLWTISPNGGSPKQLTHNTHPVGSAFSWSSDGAMIAHAMDQSVCVTRVDTGNTVRLTQRRHGQLRPEACVFSPDDRKVAYVRHVPNDGDESEGSWNQIFVLDVKAAMAAGQ